MQYAEIRQQIVSYGQRMYSERLVTSTSGNISMRIPGEPDLMAITPGSEDYMTMTPDRVVIMRLDGTIVDGEAKPSSEWRMHAGLYLRGEHIGAVIHTHSPSATAFAVTHEEIPVVLIEMVFWLGGSIPVADFAYPGTAQMAESAWKVLQDRHGCLLANHGVLAVGPDLNKAYARAAYVEDAANIYRLACGVGKPVVLSEEIIRGMD